MFPLFSEHDLQTTILDSLICLSAKLGSEDLRGLSELCHSLTPSSSLANAISVDPQAINSSMHRIIEAINPHCSQSAAVCCKK